MKKQVKQVKQHVGSEEFWSEVEEVNSTEQENGVKIEEIIDEEIVRDLSKAVEFEEEGNTYDVHAFNEL